LNSNVKTKAKINAISYRDARYQLIRAFIDCG